MTQDYSEERREIGRIIRRIEWSNQDKIKVSTWLVALLYLLLITQ